MERPARSKCAAMPPGSGAASKSVTSWPRVRARYAAASPIAPAPSTTIRAMAVLPYRRSKLKHEIGVLRVEESLLQRLPQRRGRDVEPLRPIVDGEDLRDDQGLELACGKRRVPVKSCIKPEQGPESAIGNMHDPGAGPHDVMNHADKLGVGHVLDAR